MDSELRTYSVCLVCLQESLALTTPQSKGDRVGRGVFYVCRQFQICLPISWGLHYLNDLLVSEGDAEIHLYQEDVWTRFSIEGGDGEYLDVEF